MRKPLKYIAWISSLALACIAGWLGSEIPFHKQWPLFEALRTTASIIFAVVGAWIAIVYPDRLRLSFSKDTQTKNNHNGLSQLFSPIVHSTTILCIILLIGITAPILQTINALDDYNKLLRGASYFTLVTLTLWQLWTVILTLIPADAIKTISEREDEHRTLVDGYTKRSSKI